MNKITEYTKKIQDHQFSELQGEKDTNWHTVRRQILVYLNQKNDS